MIKAWIKLSAIGVTAIFVSYGILAQLIYGESVFSHLIDRML